MTDKMHSGDESRSSLDPAADEIRRWGNAAIEVMASYLDSIRDRPVYPRTTARKIREKLDRALPNEESFRPLLETSTLPRGGSRHNVHPRIVVM